MNIENSLNYFLGKYKEYCLITFIGILSLRSIVRLESCLNEIKDNECSNFILNFNHTEITDKSLDLFLINLSHIAHKKKTKFKLCGLDESLEKELLSSNILKPENLTKDPRYAIKEF
tara:strand:+ start:454 stop:804 length:351 start_codon:yes stop_codon:yes gene_type:complete